jgi:hypothetical protein
MTNNLLIEDPRRIDQGHGNRQIHVLQILQSTFSHIHRNREAISFKICIVQKFMCQSTYRCRKLS